MKKVGAGATHLEFVLSFVIFVLFLVFLYGGIEPIVETAGSKQFVLNHLRTSLIENFTLSDFTIQTFTIDLTGVDLKNKECIKFDGNTGGKLWELAEEQDLTIKAEGRIVNYSFNPGESIMGIGILTSSDTLLKVYYASAFQKASPALDKPENCEPLKEKLEIETITEQEIISESNIFDICDTYDSEGGYEKLKDILGIPAGSDFSFEFIDTEGTKICPENPISPPQNVNIYVGEIPIQYIDVDATTKIGFLRIRVW